MPSTGSPLSSPSCAGSLVPGRVRGTDARDPGRRVVNVDSATVSEVEELRASPPIFPSPTLDRLTRSHPAMPALVFLPVVCFFGVLAVRDLGVPEALLGAGGGYVFWTLCEYWGHRTVFHFEPENGFGARLHWMIHGVHHDHPTTHAAWCCHRPFRSRSRCCSWACSLSCSVDHSYGRWRPGSISATSSTTPSTSPFTTRIRKADSGIAFANCICATTSKTTSAASASAPPGGTSSSTHARAAAQPVNKSRLRERPLSPG